MLDAVQQAIGWNPRSSPPLCDSSAEVCPSGPSVVARNVCWCVRDQAWLSEPPSDVVLGFTHSRRSEDPLRFIELNKLSVEEKACLVGYARRLLHVVGHDDDRVVLLEIVDQFLDFGRRD